MLLFCQRDHVLRYQAGIQASTVSKRAPDMQTDPSNAPPACGGLRAWRLNSGAGSSKTAQGRCRGDLKMAPRMAIIPSDHFLWIFLARGKGEGGRLVILPLELIAGSSLFVSVSWRLCESRMETRCTRKYKVRLGKERRRDWTSMRNKNRIISRHQQTQFVDSPCLSPFLQHRSLASSLLLLLTMFHRTASVFSSSGKCASCGTDIPRDLSPKKITETHLTHREKATVWLAFSERGRNQQRNQAP